MLKVTVLFLILYLALLTPAEPGLPTTKTTPVPAMVTPDTTTSSDECQKMSNGTCEDCVRKVQCYYCKSTKKCTFFPYGKVFPSLEDCRMGDIHWGLCWFSFEAMIISMGVLTGIIIISVICCLCYCCNKRRRRALERDEHRYQQEREERRVAAAERRTERQMRNDELRRKYGLLKDNNPYQRFDT